MKLTFYSNFLNHHQLEFCMEMHKILGDDFKFIATEPITEERLRMGYLDMSTQYTFALNTYGCKEAFKVALKLGDESDVVMIGSAPKLFIKNRIKDNKLTFYYSERLFKKGKWRILNPITFMSLFKNHTMNKNKNVYVLCASAYTASDFRLMGAYKNKTYKWGYFPELKQYDIGALINKKKQNKTPKLLWVGRLLELKHPEDAVNLALRLKKDNYNFSLDIIGIGDMQSKLNNMIDKNNLNNEVKLLGSMKPEEVREHMEKANIFLFTSDFNEGWGAVLNEAMNSGCAVVASHAIGSVPFLIKHKENGLIYESGNINHLFESIKYLIDKNGESSFLGLNAYNTIKETWNAKEATKRLIELSKSLINGKQLNFDDGPCSTAEIKKNNWLRMDKNEHID